MSGLLLKIERKMSLPKVFRSFHCSNQLFKTESERARFVTHDMVSSGPYYHCMKL